MLESSIALPEPPWFWIFTGLGLLVTLIMLITWRVDLWQLSAALALVVIMIVGAGQYFGYIGPVVWIPLSFISLYRLLIYLHTDVLTPDR